MNLTVKDILRMPANSELIVPVQDAKELNCVRNTILYASEKYPRGDGQTYTTKFDRGAGKISIKTEPKP